ncbi:MAG: hypothetical protein PHC68_02620 [Syntrophorhabdaceae bacterium]|nr:hypothetical protein [Syntrophorhabdaceae bacterium]
MIEKIKFFHELTEKEFMKIKKDNPHMTYAEFALKYPQPTWCHYPDAVYGIMGCWSLVTFMVKDKKYCKGCDCLIKRKKAKKSGKAGE